MLKPGDKVMLAPPFNQRNEWGTIIDLTTRGNARVLWVDGEETEERPEDITLIAGMGTKPAYMERLL